MASTVKGKQDSHLRIVSSEDAVVFPENATPTDDAPTVISKNPPLLEAPASDKRTQLGEMTRQSLSPETLVASLRGRRLAHFELIEPVGVGGMAAVIRARDTQLDRFVALKILPPEMALEIENVQRFHQEAKAAAKLDHENIARVFFCGEDQGLHFIAFEFVEGTNLRALLERRRLIPVGEAIRYILQIAAGLEHAASRGVVHRDVKPSNIIITPTGRAKLVDMGLARNLERHGERDLTQSGVTLGTFDYISPEQALEPRDADSRSDVYSLGCTFYHMLTGIPPVPDGTPAKKLNHHQHINPVDPRLLHPGIPDAVVEVLGKMMAKKPTDRFQRPLELIERLMEIVPQIGKADAPEGVLFLEAPVSTQPRSRPFLVIGLALVSLVVVILGLSLLPEPRPVTPVEPPVTPAKDKKREVVSLDSKKPSTPTQAPLAIRNPQQFRAVLADPSSKNITAPIRGVIDLKNESVIYEGARDQTLEISSSDDVGFSTIKFGYVDDGPTAGLVIDGGDKVIFRRIRFQMDCRDYNPLYEAVATIRIRKARHVLFDHCVFPQDVKEISLKSVPIASVLVDTGEETEAPVVVLNNCLFGGESTGGQVAIAVNGPVTLSAKNCAFRSHGALFHLRSKCSPSATTLRVEHGAAFIGKGPAFRFDEKSLVESLYVGNSVFSNPNGELPQHPELPPPNLIHVKDSGPVPFKGTQNLYHNLNYLIANAKDEADFQKYLGARGFDHRSLYLLDRNNSPWEHGPERSDPLAFQLKGQYHGTFGLTASWQGTPIPKAALLPAVAKTMPKTKTVDADDPGGTPGVYRTLDAAIGEAQDGDVILIKHGDDEHREVKVSARALPAGVSITLKPHDDYDPVLVLDRDNALKDSYLFKVPGKGQKLTLENLKVMLDPGTAAFDALSVVQLGEGAQCIFKQCPAITLRASDSVKPNVVTFLDVANMAKVDGAPPPAPPEARVEFIECFVRGTGDVIHLRGNQLLHVDIKSSLFVLAGQMLDLQSMGKASPDRFVNWRMEQSSIYTTDSIFALRSDTPRGLNKTQASFTGSLFVALTADQPIVPEMDVDEPLATYLAWTGERNFYAGFTKLNTWKTTFPESGSSFEAASLMLPGLEKLIDRLWEATPEMLRVPEADAKRLAGFGVPASVSQRWMQDAPANEP